jgi:hypothetical protein
MVEILDHDPFVYSMAIPVAEASVQKLTTHEPRPLGSDSGSDRVADQPVPVKTANFAELVPLE